MNFKIGETYAYTNTNQDLIFVVVEVDARPFLGPPCAHVLVLHSDGHPYKPGSLTYIFSVGDVSKRAIRL